MRQNLFLTDLSPEQMYMTFSFLKKMSYFGEERVHTHDWGRCRERGNRGSEGGSVLTAAIPRQGLNSQMVRL